MKNIGILIQHLTGGGAEKAASNLSLLLEKDYNVFMIVFDSSDITYTYGGKLLSLDLPSQKNVFSKMGNIVARTKKLRNLKQKYNLDVTISFLNGPNIINVLSKVNDEIIISIRNYTSYFLKSSKLSILYKLIYKFLYSKANKIVCVSEMTKRDFEKYLLTKDQHKLTTIYNFIDNLDIIERSSDKVEKELCETLKNKFVYGCLGRVEKTKGQFLLLNAFKSVSLKDDYSHLLIIGDGSDKLRCMDFVKENNMENCVTFIEYVENPYKYIKNCSCYVLPSLVEGMPNVLLESMVLQIPIIATDCLSGPREILSKNYDTQLIKDITYSDYGILIPRLDDEKNREYNLTLLSKAMELIKSDEILKQKYIDYSKERIKEFSKEKIKEKWISILEKRY